MLRQGVSQTGQQNPSMCLMQTLSEQVKTLSVATQTDFTWDNNTAYFDLKDNKATETNMYGTNNCNFVLPPIPVHVNVNGKPTAKVANSRVLAAQDVAFT